MKLVLASFILILSYSASAQRTYIKEWKRIDSLIEKAGLIKTALKETNNNYLFDSRDESIAFSDTMISSFRQRTDSSDPRTGGRAESEIDRCNRPSLSFS